MSGPEKANHALTALLDFPIKMDFLGASVPGCVDWSRGENLQFLPPKETGMRAACPENTAVALSDSPNPPSVETGLTSEKPRM